MKCGCVLDEVMIVKEISDRAFIKETIGFINARNMSHYGKSDPEQILLYDI